MFKFTRTNVKRIVKFLVGLCTAWTVGNVIGNNVAPNNNFRKAEAIVGGTVIGAMVAEKAEDWTDRKIDEFADIFSGNKDATIHHI